MPVDPYAVLRALLRAEAARSAPKPEAQKQRPQQSSAKEQSR